MRKILGIISTLILSASIVACSSMATTPEVTSKNTTISPQPDSTQTKPTTETQSAPVATIKETAKTDSNCRENPLAGVYHPSRLVVKENCRTVSGTVEKVRSEKDGDHHINVKLDSQYADLINDKNKSAQTGDLVVEVIPIDAKQVPVPKAGQHITITGAYVLDKQHGWMEIHPAWIIDGKGSIDYDKDLAKKYEEGDPNKVGIEDEEEGNDTSSEQPSTVAPVPVTPSPAPQPVPKTNVYYANCSAARAAGVTPIYRGQPEYSSKLDRDGDGIACE